MRDVIVDIDVITDAVALACRAPSLHNSQPWRWVSEGPVVSLFLDDAQTPKLTDPTGRELLISCGAALDHFRVAMAAAGWTCNVDRFPNPNNRDHLASVDFTPLDFVTEAHRRRADAIARRRTDRLPYARPADWDVFLGTISRGVGSNGVSVFAIGDARQPELVRASELTRTARLYDSGYHAELVGWTSEVAVAEGIPEGTLPSDAESKRVAIGRDFPVAAHADRRRDISDDDAEVVVLSTEDCTRDSRVRCGELLSSILLDATMAGLATCTLSHLTEVPASREIVRQLTGSESTPELLVRIGSAPAPDDIAVPTPRRRVTDVLEIRR